MPGPQTDFILQCLVLESKLIANSFSLRIQTVVFSFKLGEELVRLNLHSCLASLRQSPPGPPLQAPLSAWPLTPLSFRPHTSS